MGEVFKGIDTGLNRKVAIKILSEKHRDSPELRHRFVREGRARPRGPGANSPTARAGAEPTEAGGAISAPAGSLSSRPPGPPPFPPGPPADDKSLKVVARPLRNPPPDAALTNPAVDPELS